MQLRLDKPYILFCVLIGTGALAFIGWAITNQVYGQWSLGIPITGGFNWPIVISIDLICLLGILALYWKIYADANINVKGLSRLTLRELKHITWLKIVTIRVFNGVSFHVHGGAGKIVVSLYVYHEPNQVIERYINTALKVERKCALIIPSRGTTHKLCLWVPFAASPLRRPLTFTLGI